MPPRTGVCYGPCPCSGHAAGKTREGRYHGVQSKSKFGFGSNLWYATFLVAGVQLTFGSSVDEKAAARMVDWWGVMPSHAIANTLLSSRNCN